MSDFKSQFWSYWIAAITIGGIIYCMIILVTQIRAKTNKPGQEDLQPHVWDDDLQEYNNPMPRWWVFMFFATTIFGIAYLALYPGLGAYKGLRNWTSANEYEIEKKEFSDKAAPLYAQFLKTPIPELAENPEAMKLGKRMFENNCAQCHGLDGKGSKGFPNLTDSDWLYGGFPKAIEVSLLGGRNGIMPSQAASLKTPGAINDVANYVLSLSSSPHDATAAARGKTSFALCATCHMPDGKGSLSDKSLANFGVGAPNLTDKTWLYGGSVKTITEGINAGRNNVMPAWECALGREPLYVLTAYVWQLNREEGTGKVLNPTEAPDYMVDEVNKRIADLDAQRAAAKETGQSTCLATSLHETIRKQNELAAEKALKEIVPATPAANAKP
jgi:cytochrome c oxidase cbb3-type subunit 3